MLAGLSKHLGGQLKGDCDGSGQRKVDLNWSGVWDGEERNQEQWLVEEGLWGLSNWASKAVRERKQCSKS